MSNQISQKDQDSLVGGYTPFRCINAEDQKIFDQVQFPLGVSYTPVAVATQPVAGINYNFFCNAKVTAPYVPNSYAFVTIYQALDGSLKVTNVVFPNNIELLK